MKDYVTEEVEMMALYDFEKLTSVNCKENNDESTNERKPVTVTNSVVDREEAL